MFKWLKRRAYKKYMQSKEWKNLRIKVLKRDKYKCFICDHKENLEVHHLGYPRNIKDTKMYQLIAVCRKCHVKIHKKVGQ